MASVTKEMENHKMAICCGRPEIHRDQAIVDTLSACLVISMLWKCSCPLAGRLSVVVSALIKEVT